MERFRLRVRFEAKRGQVWELHVFPNMPNRLPREADAKIMGSSASPATVQWLRELSDPFLRRADEPGPIAAADFRTNSPPRWLRHEDGMRLALVFASARYVTKPAQRTMFQEGLMGLPGEVLLYWFTLCFYGYRQQAGRAALRTLLTYEQAQENSEPAPKRRLKKRAKVTGPTLFDLNGSNGISEKQAEAKANAHAGKQVPSIE